MTCDTSTAAEEWTQEREHAIKFSEDVKSFDHKERSMAAPDGGYGWVVCAVSASVMFLDFGTIECYGILYVELLDYFGEGRTKTSLIGAFSFLGYALAGPISSTVAHRIGHRMTVIVGIVVGSSALVISAFATSIYYIYLYITLGLMTGVGVGMSSTQSFALLALYFERRRGLAMSIALSCGATAFLIYPILTYACIKHYTWRGTVIIMGAIWLQMCVGGALLRPIINKIIIKPNEPEELYLEKSVTSIASGRVCEGKLFKMWQFWVYIMMVFLIRADLYTFVHILPDFAIIKGHVGQMGAILLTIFGSVALPIRPIAGFLADRPEVDKMLFFFFSTVAFSALTFIFPYVSDNYVAMAVITAGKGIIQGIYGVLFLVLVVLLFDRRRVTTAFGFNSMAINLGGLMSSPLAGMIKDQTGDYKYSYLVAGTFSLVAAALSLILFLDNRRTFTKNTPRCNDTKTPVLDGNCEELKPMNRVIASTSKS